MDPVSCAVGLRCIDCGTTLPLAYTLQCPRCSGLLELRYDADRLQKEGPSIFAGGSLWRYAPVLPIADPAHRISLGEGQTPLLDCPRLGKRLGVRRLVVKFEGSNPTGTVKDRTSATAIGAALQFGFRATSVVSSGNAGSSIGAYSARAGLRSGDIILEVDGQPDRLAEEGLFFDCGASRNPYKHEGKKTIAYEIAEQLGWRAPDVLVAPTAVGETFIAAHRGFAEMERWGFIPRQPIMAAAQAARANTIVTAWRDKAPLAPIKIGYTVAEGLAAGNPGRKGEWVLRILRETGGVAGQAEDDEILAAQKMLAREEGIWAGPTGSASLAVLIRLLDDQLVDPASTICVIVSETGLKTEAPPPALAATAFDAASLRRLVQDKLAADR